MSQAGLVDVIGSTPEIPILFVANTGSATPAANTLNILGTGIITTVGSGDTITIEATSAAAETLTGNTGGAVAPTANNINVVGDGTTITVAGNPGTSTLTISAIGTGILETLTGNSGGAISPTAGNINTVGTGSITIAGAGSTLTSQLTGLTNHNVLVGAGTATITKVAPSATSGVPLISQGAASDPAFGTAVVAGGGTGDTSFTAFAPICGGTTTTGALQSASTGQATSGFVLTSTGSSSLPTFQAVSASGAITTITGNSGGAESPTAGGNFNIVGTGSITVAGSANTETVQLTGLTNHSLLVGAGTATITNLGVATNGQLPIGSAGADPVLATLTAGTGISITNGAGSITIAATGSEMTWTDEGTSFNAVAGNGYFITATATATLPASPSQGNVIAFAVDAAATTLTITANTGQVIRIGAAVSAAAGTAANNARGDSVTLVYRSSDTAWIATSVIGTWVVT